jgi:LuxR family maltose regulon positive regulatory protein
VALAEISAARGRLTVAERSLAEARELLAGCADPGRVTAFADAAGERLRALRDGAARPVEPLSKSEIAVLRLFDEDRSARAIGAELYLSLNTVKTHIRAIYRKLAVNSREDALARGEELGLL